MIVLLCVYHSVWHLVTCTQTMYPRVKDSFISLMMYFRYFGPREAAILTRVFLPMSRISRERFLSVRQTFNSKLQGGEGM
jgi:hypothetical protein